MRKTLLLSQLMCAVLIVSAAPSPSLQPIAQSAETSSEKKCDFAEFKPLSISHFYPNSVVKAVKPKYPSEAINQKIQGWVMVKVLVNREGNVENACATQGPDVLRHTAEAAAVGWKFKPNFGLSAIKRRPGQTREIKYAQAILPFHFVLNKADASVGITVLP